MAGRFAKGLVAGLVLGLAVAGAVSLTTGRPGADPVPAQIAPVGIERTYGPPGSGLPRLRSAGPPAPAVPQGVR